MTPRTSPEWWAGAELAQARGRPLLEHATGHILHRTEEIGQSRERSRLLPHVIGIEIVPDPAEHRLPQASAVGPAGVGHLHHRLRLAPVRARAVGTGQPLGERRVLGLDEAVPQHPLGRLPGQTGPDPAREPQPGGVGDTVR